MSGFSGETQPLGLVDQISQPSYVLLRPVLHNHPDMDMQWSPSDIDVGFYAFPWEQYDPANDSNWDMLSELVNFHESQFTQANQETAYWFESNICNLVGDQNIPDVEDNTTQSPQPSPAKTALELPPTQYDCSPAQFAPVNNEDLWDDISELVNGYESTSQPTSSEKEQVPADWMHRSFLDLLLDKDISNVEVGSNNPSPQPGPANHQPTANPVLEPLSTGHQNLPADINNVQHIPLSISPSQAGKNQDLL